MAAYRILIVPLAAAFAAALFAHVGIDIAGDYLLPHDAYDDVVHGSRALVLGIVATLLAALASAAICGALREAGGCVDAFGRTVRSSLNLGFGTTLLLTFVCASLTLAAMEYADVRAAGAAIDDLGDLFGGSLVLGSTIVALAAWICSAAMRALVRALAGAGRVLIRAIVTAFAARATTSCRTASAYGPAVRLFARGLFFGTSRSGRAPPRRPIVRPI